MNTLSGEICLNPMHYIKRTPVHNLYNTFEVDDMVVFKSKITYEFSTCK